MRVLVITADRFLLRKAELELSEIAEITSNPSVVYDTLIYDCDSGLPVPDFEGRIIRLSRSRTDSAEPLPLPLGRLKELVLAQSSEPPLSLSVSDRCAILKGKKIKLTSHEFSLLSLLVEGGEGYTSRKEISERVFGDASDGLINIYIHYLREKLEYDGEKIILSSRKSGYRINEKYLKGDTV